jgi:hypothetical protein
MALLDTASLIVTPNGYKASKLYSIVPSDGTGDMTFSRTGDTATRVNSSGLIETVLANKPRLDYTDSTCPKLLLEPQRTNLLNYSEQFENSYWTKNNITITANSTTAPDGNTTADTFNATNTTFNILRRSVTTTIGTVYTSSIFVKKNNYRYIGMRAIYAGTDIFNFYDFDTNTITNAGSSSNPLKVENYGNGWYRLSQTSTATLTSHLFDIGYVNSSGNNAALAAGTEKYYVWGAQVEAGSFATSYIPTTTASVTRNVDSCTKSSATALIGQTEGAMVIDVDINSRISSTQFMLRNTAVTSYISFIITSSVIQCAIYNASTQTVTINYTNSSTGRFKLGIAYKLNDVAYYINGSLIGTDTSTDIPAMTEIDLYFNANNFLKVNSFTHWKTRLTNSELAQLTTL